MRTLPWQALAAGAIWLILVSVAHRANAAGAQVPTCFFRHWTGVPCPACGTTRAAFSLLRADPIAALAMNPLMTIAMVCGTAWVLLATVSGHPRRWLVPVVHRVTHWTLIIVIVVANWAYVIWHETAMHAH